MATVILVRHGRSTANAQGVLAGRTPGVLLDDTGDKQVGRTAERIADVPLAGVVSSPLERCRQTAQAILRRQDATASGTGLTLATDDRLNECDYGDWQGCKLADLAKEELWKTVTGEPSKAIFPGGESLTDMQARAVAAVRSHDAAIQEQHGDKAVWVAVTHGDIIKSVIADAYGMPFDHFQRVHANPASVSIVHYPAEADSDPHVLAVNTEAGDLSWLRPKEGDGKAQDVAQVGGGAGHD
ncbi:MAG: MSMEG_4193 family putative phosphomutase [Corynebacterium sp.]|uniref:MSMEG_4193 family putative phosphomutase n=1 Tax=Corynebacterium sp. TaxID=1720 RepID=UPI003F96206A